ncbi:MAG: methyltransferase domain-containing protein [Alphaproteobacteria bacterium]|nr:methyltransferase domain-containing protein [Alphaproteobacteria bacterium]
MEEPFDRRAVRRHRDRAARRFGEHDFLVRAAAERLADRLGDAGRTFGTALVIGAAGGILREATAPFADTVIEMDLSLRMLRRPAVTPGLVASEELLPFAGAAFDLVVSALTLHWANDLPGALVQIRRSLRADGLLLASMFGGETLRELRAAWLAGEAAAIGGASPRISPFVDVRDAGGLLQRTGFARPVADVEFLDVTYATPLKLMQELRGMGETNALRQRRRTFTTRGSLVATEAAYRADASNADRRVRATFQLLTLTGWAAAPQTQPAGPEAERPPAAGLPRRLRPA